MRNDSKEGTFMGWGPRGGEVDLQSHLAGRLELRHCDSRGLSEGLWAPWQEQGWPGGRNGHLPDVSSLPVGCLSAPITARTISDPFLLIHYDTSEQFDLCLSNEVLKANLEPLLQQPLTVEYLQVIKTKLEQVMGGTGTLRAWRHPSGSSHRITE